MSVTTPETFKITGGVTASELAALADNLNSAGITNTTSGAVITVTNSALAGANGISKFSDMVRIAKAGGCAVTYTAAS